MSTFFTTTLSILFALSAFAQEPSLSGKTEAEITPAEEAKEKKSPVELSLTVKSDVVRTLSGGVQRRNRWIGDFEAGVAADLEQLLSIPSASINLQGFVLRGSRPSLSVGDLQLTSNLDAPSAAKLYQAYLEKNFLDDALSLAVGVLDMNSDFYWQELAGDLFMNSSMSLGAELANSGEMGPSSWPNTSWGARFKAAPTEWSYITLGGFDAVPGDVENPQRTDLRLSSEEGALALGETGVMTGQKTLPGKYSLGGWAYTQRHDTHHLVDADGSSIQRRNFGAYVMAEQKLWNLKGSVEQGLSAFSRVGFANPDVNPVLYNVSAGLVFRGFMAERFNDRLGLAVTVAGISRRFRDAEISASREESSVEPAALVTEAGSEEAALAGGFSPATDIAAQASPLELANTEITIEATYKFNVISWLAVQPDFQYIFNPGFGAQVKRASVGGLRLVAEF